MTNHGSWALRGPLILLGCIAFACSSDEEPAGTVPPIDVQANDAGGSQTEGGSSTEAGADADANGDGGDAGVNLPPTVANGNLSVEVGGTVAGQLTATDPEGDPITFAIVKSPSSGTLSGFDATTGLFLYKPTTTTPAKDSLGFTATDAKHPAVGPATVDVDIAPFSMFRTWVTTDVVKDSQSCNGTELTIAKNGNVVTISSRSYKCGATTTTLGSLTLDVVGNKLYRQSDGVEVGSFTATSLVVEQSASVSGCGTVSQWFRVLADANGYKLEDGYTSGSCGAASVTARLHRGAHLSIVSSGDFGKLRYPGPYDRTIYIGSDGDLDATAIAPTPSSLAAPFTFKGGTWPGTGGTCGATLAAGQFCSVVVSVGGTTGSFAATLGASYSNGGATKSTSLPLSVELWRPAALAFTPSPLDFGVQDRTLLPKSASVTVKNDGTVPATSVVANIANVTGSAFSFTGGNYPGSTGTCGATIAAGATCTLDLQFGSSLKGKYASTLSLAFFDGAANANATLPVAGVATNFVAYGLVAKWPEYTGVDVVPFYDLGGWGAKITSLNDYSYKELAYDAASDVFFLTDRHTKVASLTRTGVLANITPVISWPSGAAVDPSRNRLVVSGRLSNAIRALGGTTWSTAASSNFEYGTMKYRASDDTFIAFDPSYFTSAKGSYTTLNGSTLAAVGSDAAIDFSGLKDVYFDTSGDRTQLITTNASGKMFIIGQARWWKTGDDAAAAVAFNTYKVAGYELDPTTKKLSLVWEVPENAVQPASTTGLYGVGVYEGGCVTAPCNVDVTVSTGIDTVLLLSSYSAVNWRLTVTAGTTLKKVIVRSYYANTVENAGTATVDNKASSLNAYGLGLELSQLRYQIENQTKLTMVKFQGAYRQASFTVTK